MAVLAALFSLLGLNLAVELAGHAAPLGQDLVVARIVKLAGHAALLGALLFIARIVKLAGRAALLGEDLVVAVVGVGTVAAPFRGLRFSVLREEVGVVSSSFRLLLCGFLPRSRPVPFWARHRKREGERVASEEEECRSSDEGREHMEP